MSLLISSQIKIYGSHKMADRFRDKQGAHLRRGDPNAPRTPLPMESHKFPEGSRLYYLASQGRSETLFLILLHLPEEKKEKIFSHACVPEGCKASCNVVYSQLYTFFSSCPNKKEICSHEPQPYQGITLPAKWGKKSVMIVQVCWEAI